MGHTEMVLAVAGLDERAIGERVGRLASGDWSSFPPAERVAFLFAHKQARDPASVAAAGHIVAAASLTATIQNQKDAPPCPKCGHIAVRNGACYKCLNCGESLGCS